MTSIMGLLSKLEQEDRTISQRDIYYAFKSLFRKQEECNRTIISLGKVLGRMNSFAPHANSIVNLLMFTSIKV